MLVGFHEDLNKVVYDHEEHITLLYKWYSGKKLYI